MLWVSGASSVGAVLSLPFDVVLPGATIESVDRQSRARLLGTGVRLRFRGDTMVARRWVQGVYATGHSVVRARLVETPDGLRVLGSVTPSGIDLVLVAIWVLAALGIAAVTLASGGGVLVMFALVPLAFGVAFAAMLPRAVREGREVVERSLRAAV